MITYTENIFNVIVKKRPTSLL